MVTMTPIVSGEFIVKNAKYLKVNLSAISALAKEVITALKNNEIDINSFSQNELHPKKTDPFAIDWIFLVDTLNFCFWTPGDGPKWTVNNQTGYFALCAAINRAIVEGFNITKPEYYAKMTEDQLAYILRSDDGVTQIPLLKERLQCLHEVGGKVLEKYYGKFEYCVSACDKSAVKLLQLIVTEFHCYRDEAIFANQRVSLYKRAQILIGDLWSCFGGEGIGCFDDISQITMFADYRVPQVLVHFKTLEYNPELLDALKEDTILRNGDDREIEIRGASIYIVEKLKHEIIKEIDENHPDISTENVNSIVLDHFLWDYRRKHAEELKYIPFHKTYSIFY